MDYRIATSTIINHIAAHEKAVAELNTLLADVMQAEISKECIVIDASKFGGIFEIRNGKACFTQPITAPITITGDVDEEWFAQKLNEHRASIAQHVDEYNKDVE